jgi:hypothetical protein
MLSFDSIKSNSFLQSVKIIVAIVLAHTEGEMYLEDDIPHIEMKGE